MLTKSMSDHSSMTSNCTTATSKHTARAHRAHSASTRRACAQRELTQRAHTQRKQATSTSTHTGAPCNPFLQHRTPQGRNAPRAGAAAAIHRAAARPRPRTTVALTARCAVARPRRRSARFAQRPAPHHALNALWDSAGKI